MNYEEFNIFLIQKTTEMNLLLIITKKNITDKKFIYRI